ncbi:MAG: hypothetical protein ACTSSE_04405 [Candidatus Thorarchaeota archaeon]
MKIKKMMGLLLVFLPLLLGIFITPGTYVGSQETAESKTVNLSNGDTLEIAPDEVVTEYHISDAPTEVSGTGDPLYADESGVRIDTFTDAEMYYNSATSTTATANLSVPLGEGWESYAVYADVTSITENRSWVQNPGLDDASQWTFLTHDEPSSFGPSYTNPMTSAWEATGHDGAGCSRFWLDGYWYNAGGGLYGDWYDVGDKAYMVQNLTIDRGDVTSVGISLDYWGDVAWGIMTGFFELFVSIGDPDNGGTYLWSLAYDAFTDDLTWYNTGYIEVDISNLDLPNVSLWCGLRTTALEWWRGDINPVGRMDNIVVYVTAKATPDDVNLQMNGVDVSNVIQGVNPVFGLGTSYFVPITPWTHGAAYANFSWTPSPNPPVPDEDINVNIDVNVWVFARKLASPTINDTELITLGDKYSVNNATDVNWETNYYVSIPGGYEDQFFFNVTIPMNRDVTFVSEPAHRYTNLLTGWSLGDPGDGVVNVSVYELGLTDPTGFWMIRGDSPNMVTNLQVWDDTGPGWVETKTFRADEDTRFRAILPSTYENDIVTFTVYDSYGEVWDTLTGTVDASGYAVSSYVTLDAVSARVGTWEVQAVVDDSVSSTEVHNIGYYRRAFSIDHSTALSIKYPIESIGTWSINVTYGDLVFLQLRVEDTDNSDLLPGGVMTYSSTGFGSGTVNDMGTGEYSITFDTGTLSSNGGYDIDLSWTKANYDLLADTFTINVIYDTDLLSSDAPGIDVASGNSAALNLYFEDMLAQPILDASITCNWTQGYTITPDGSGNYLLSLDTTGMTLDIYQVLITAAKNYHESRSIILTVDVRELHTSAIPSSSLVSLPVGYTTSFTVTYRDTDLQVPISGAESYINCNWSDIHKTGDQNFTVAETATPGVYEVVIYSMDDDALDTYDVVFTVERFGAQNHTFIVAVELRTHITSLYLENSIDPTAYTGNITVNLVYYDVDADTGIVNGTTLGGYVELIITSPTLPFPDFYVVSISPDGMYTIHIPANQWGDVGDVTLDFEVNWIGVNYKYEDLTLDSIIVITAAPTDIYIGESPVITSYGEDISFSIVFYDVGGLTGVVNNTGPYAGNLHLYIDVLTGGETITQADMTILEIDPTNRPGEYRITFDSSLLTSLGSVELKLWLNWTNGELPYYQNQVIVVTVTTANRLTVVDWNPLPLTPYDELVNLTFVFRDSLTSLPILDSSELTISVPGYSFNIYYDGDVTGIFIVEVDTSAFTPGSHTFTLNVEWAGSPFYQNRTGVEIYITVRERYTDLTHGTYSPVEYQNTLHLNFTYRDLDDYTSIGMNGGTLSLDAWLLGDYTVDDLGNGVYTIHLDTSVFPGLGTFTVNVSIVYNGVRYCADAYDAFYLSLTARRTQLTSDLPELAPYLTEAVIVIYYTDDSTATGIPGAIVSAFCATSDEVLQFGVNYWVDDNSDGSYDIRIDTVALGNFGSYSIEITVSYATSPFYQTRVRDIDIEVSRRPSTLSVSKSPLNTPYEANVTFEITITDQLDSSGITIDKSNLILTHNGGTLITNGEYSISGSNGVYVISINSLVLVSDLEDNWPISITFVWGDVTPYYANATSSTQVSIVARFTQATVLQTPPGYYYFNMSALVRYSDYLTGDGIDSATITLVCLNETVFDYWVQDNTDGTYTIIIDTNTLSGLGRFFFEANFTWTGVPYYEDVNLVGFSIVVNPVSTALNFVLPEGVTYYLGDTIYANITYVAIEFGTGITAALVETDWSLTPFSITEIDVGVYEMTIDTSGLNAQSYRFNINATKASYLTQTIEVDILLAAIPVQIDLVFSPANPVWGDVVEFQANVTDARTGASISGAYVNLTLDIVGIDMTEVAAGLYNCTIPTAWLDSGEYAIRVQSVLVNYESRQRDFQIRIDKIPATIAASIDPQSAVNGQTITLEVDYEIYSNGSAIEQVGVVTYSWVGGTGSIAWSAGDGKYIGTFIVTDALVGTHQILVQASSPNFRSVSMQVTIEITEITTVLSPISPSVEIVNYRDFTNITVYLENTDLTLPVDAAFLTWGVGNYTGNLIELANPGYYSAYINTSLLSVQEWLVIISSDKPGYTPSTIQFTLNVEQIETEILISAATISVYYGEMVTFYFEFSDTQANVGIPGAITSYTLEQFSGPLVDYSNGTYSLTLNSSIVTAGSVPHDIAISFRKDNYHFAYGLVKLLANPIPTEVVGPTEATFAIHDDYTMSFTFWDTLNNQTITDGVGTVIWDFAPAQLTNLGNGTYVFGPTEANLGADLQDQEIPYSITVSISRGNYSRTDIAVSLTIRQIDTELVINAFPDKIFVGETFLVNVTFIDVDHNEEIQDAEWVFKTSSRLDDGLIRVPEEDIDWGNGTYTFAFRAPNLAFYTLEITLRKLDYQPSTELFDIYADLSPEQEALVAGFQYGTMGLLAIAAFAALYFRVLSVPRLLRIIRRMISALSKGRIPSAADVPRRREMLLIMMNEDLEPVRIKKTIDDISLSTVDIAVMDVEDLLEQLAYVVGLTEGDVDTLRRDLDQMRPSERAGFINEVLKQERARRAKELAEAEAAVLAPGEEIEEALSDEELEHLKERLLKMGIEETEADLMVEQAKNLTRAEIDALLSEIGGSEE